jgi:hypothetical protein
MLRRPFNSHVHRLESLCHQPKMYFASASRICIMKYML